MASVPPSYVLLATEMPLDIVSAFGATDNFPFTYEIPYPKPLITGKFEYTPQSPALMLPEVE